MYANKALTSGDGGFIIADNPRASKRLVSLINHGFTPRYHFVHPESCINGKLGGLAAALVLPAVQEISEVRDRD
jgi:perosamine synthetase